MSINRKKVVFGTLGSEYERAIVTSFNIDKSKMLRKLQKLCTIYNLCKTYCVSVGTLFKLNLCFTFLMKWNSSCPSHKIIGGGGMIN